MSFEGMRKSIRTMRAPISTTDAPAHLSNEFPAGYSLTRCSPAELVSALPAEIEHDLEAAQLRGFLTTDKAKQSKQNNSGSTLFGQFFCPKNGVHLIIPVVILLGLTFAGDCH